MIKHFKKYLHQMFLLSVILKGLDGVVETITGVLVFMSSRMDLKNVVIFATAPELGEDPTDLVANYLRHTVLELTVGTKEFVATYLFVNGLVKSIVVAGLIWGKLWAFRPALVLMAVFILYQLIRFTHTHSLILLFFLCVDLATLYLIWMEFRYKAGVGPV